MVATTKSTDLKKTETWRRLVVGVLIGLGCFMAAMALTANWTRNTLLDTNRFVAILAPLPQQRAVATALGTYAVDQLYQSVDVSQQIKDALPPQAAFLAGPLSSQLKTVATSTAIKTIQSDQFSTIWETVIRTGHQNLANVVKNPKSQAKVAVPFEKVTSAVQGALAKSGIDGFDGSRIAAAKDNIVTIQAQVAKIRQYVIWLNTTVMILPVLAFTLFIGALAVSRRRIKALLAITLSLAVTSALGLIGLRVGQAQLLDQIANPDYHSAAVIVWQTAVARLHQGFIIGMWSFLVLSFVIAFFSPYGWAIRLRKRLGLVPSADGKLSHYAHISRTFTRQYYKFFNLGGLAIALVSLLIWPHLLWTTILGVTAGLLIYLAIVAMVAEPAFLSA